MNSHGLEILLVEDDPVFSTLTKSTLEQDDDGCSITVHVTTDGREALQFLRRQDGFSESVRPDLILLDLNLPKLGGFEVLADVKADPDLRQIPVVIITASADQHDILRAYDEGASSYLRKPHSNNEFAGLADRIKQYWRAATPPPAPDFDAVGSSTAITKQWQDDTLILTPIKNLGEFEVMELQVSGVLENVLHDATFKNLLIDFHKTDRFGSTAIGFFVKLWKRVSERGGQFAVCCLSDVEEEVLHITQIDKLWRSYSTKQDALESINQRGREAVSA